MSLSAAALYNKGRDYISVRIGAQLKLAATLTDPRNTPCKGGTLLFILPFLRGAKGSMESFLPIEILGLVAQYVDAYDLVNFACSSSTHLYVCRKRLTEHRLREERYSQLACTTDRHLRDSSSNRRCVHLLNLTSAIKTDENITHHIRDFHLKLRDPHSGSDESKRQYETWKLDAFDGARELIQAAPFFSATEKAECTKRLERTLCTADLALFLTSRLHRLHTLRIHLNLFRMEYWKSLAKSSMSTDLNNPLNRHHHPFHRLRVLEIKSSVLCVEDLFPFPALKKLILKHSVFRSQYHPRHWILRESDCSKVRHIPVRELLADGLKWTAGGLSDLLHCGTKLQVMELSESREYPFYGTQVALPSEAPNFSQILSTSPIRSTLEQLRMATDFPIQKLDLSNMRALRTLHLQIGATDPRDAPQLCSLLPPSLEALKITKFDLHACKAEASDKLFDNVDRLSLPNLRAVDVDIRCGASQDLSDSLKSYEDARRLCERIWSWGDSVSSEARVSVSLCGTAMETLAKAFERI